jgi:hypothetical protein
MKNYKFSLPEKISFEDLAQEIVPNYDELSIETQENTLSAFAAYGCFGSPYFDISVCGESS